MTDPRVGAEDPGPSGRDDTGDLRLRLVRSMMWAALLLIMAIRALVARQNDLPWSAVFMAMVPYPPLVGLLLGPRDRRVRIALLACLAVCYALPFVVCGRQWEWLPWPLAVAALCAFRGRVAWPLFGLVLVGTDVLGLWAGRSAVVAAMSVCKTADDGLILFGLYALASMVTTLHATRDELARSQVRHEKQRLDGELRAVLGVRLHALETGLAQAIDAGPEVARDRLDECVATARTALSEIRNAAGGFREPQLGPEAPIESPKVARLALGGVFASNALLQVLAVQTEYPRPWRAALLVPLLCAAGVAVFGLRPSRRQLVVLAVILGPCVSPAGYLIPQLTGLANVWPFLAGLVLALLPRRTARLIVGAMLALYTSLFYYPPPVPDLTGKLAGVVSFLILTWTTYSLIRLSDLVTVLHRARADLAREALIRERTRVARDLHDTLSFTLSAIALKGELGRRLLRSDPAAARQTIAELPELARRARVHLESLTEKPVELCFAQELSEACAVLKSAGVQAVTTLGARPLPAHVDPPAAAVLREAVTNVIKHSRAATCSITVTADEGVIRLQVVNDGVGHPAGAGTLNQSATETSMRGSGLLGMAERTDGRLVAGPLPDGRFRVVAEWSDPAGLGGDPDGVDAVARAQLGHR
jgi:signal transduction histidine kinase